MSKATPLPIGTRVVAVSHNEGKTLYVFGSGVFEGYFLPSSVNVEDAVKQIMSEFEVARGVTPELADSEFTPEHARIALILSESNPRIKLDSGKIVWGFECWWGDVASFEKNSADLTVVERDIDEARAENEKENAAAAAFNSMLAAAQGGKIDIV